MVSTRKLIISKSWFKWGKKKETVKTKHVLMNKWVLVWSKMIVGSTYFKVKTPMESWPQSIA